MIESFDVRIHTDHCWPKHYRFELMSAGARSYCLTYLRKEVCVIAAPINSVFVPRENSKQLVWCMEGFGMRFLRNPLYDVVLRTPSEDEEKIMRRL